MAQRTKYERNVLTESANRLDALPVLTVVSAHPLRDAQDVYVKWQDNGPCWLQAGSDEAYSSRDILARHTMVAPLQSGPQ